jgi:DNA-binding NtrC family response regulator
VQFTVSEPLATVLLVDDTDVLRAYVKEVLESTGRFRVTEAATAHEGLRLLRRATQAYAAIVLDCRMPGLHGLCALAEAHEVRPDVPVIVVSADPANRVEALGRGASAFVEKVPAEYVKNLLVVLDEVLGHTPRRRMRRGASGP